MLDNNNSIEYVEANNHYFIVSRETNKREGKMKHMIEDQHNADVIVDDGGRIYELRFLNGPMTEDDVIADFMDGYDGEIDEIDVIFV